jgi:hypothetical protein
MLPQVASADSYVTFNDGRLVVFPDSCVQSISQDEEYISFVAIDGSVYSYPLDIVASIDQQLTKELPEIVSFAFNKKNNYQVITSATGIISNDTINVEVLGIGKRLTATFTLSNDAAVAYVDGIVQKSKISRLRFDTTMVYTVCDDGDLILKQTETGNCSMAPFGREYLVNVDFLTDHSTMVPRIDINTVGGVNIYSKRTYLDAEIIIDGGGIFPSMTDSVKIRGRGNSTWTGIPEKKNPYRLKFNEKVKPLGLTKGKNWVLLSNRLQGSMLTNAIGLKAASLVGTVSPNHIIPVELYINGTYKGSYNFTEKVGLANNSIDLDNESSATLLELDVNNDEPISQKFNSTPFDLPVNVKKPDFGEDETFLTLPLIMERFNDFVTAVYQGDDFDSKVNIDALARYLVVNELLCNQEIFWPKSVFCYHENILEDTCKFIFGPAWDFDWACGFVDGDQVSPYFNDYAECDFYNNVSRYTHHEFIQKLHENSKLKERMYEVWGEFISNGLNELTEFCQDYYLYAKPSLDHNNSGSGVDNIDYAIQSQMAAEWLRHRAFFIYDQLIQEHLIPGDVNQDGTVDIDDITVLISHVLLGTENINKHTEDLNGDDIVDISDISLLISMVLSNE